MIPKMYGVAEAIRISTAVLLLFVLAGCAGPIGVTRVSMESSYQLGRANPLATGQMSDGARLVLQRYNLLTAYADDPLRTFQNLHDITRTDDRRDILFAMSELSFLQGQKLLTGFSPEERKLAPDVFLQSAVYAYFYLLGDGRDPQPSAYDIRFREACDLYNRALWQAFPENENDSLNIFAGKRNLPVGTLTVELKTDTLNWNFENLKYLYPADAYAIHGFTVRNRTAGLGLPLIGMPHQNAEVPPGGVLSLTAFLRIIGNIDDFNNGNSKAFLEFYSAYDNSEVNVNGHSVPLESDTTTPLAYRLNANKLWNIGVKRFLTGDTSYKRMLLIQPYEAGRIPVVFVHGTASSPVWWAEMLNTLRADPEIRKRFQFWFYQYNSSNMIVLSAAELRETLTEMVKKLDPQQQDPALRKMVIVGHSQGGLLTKMAVVAPGDRLWNAVSDKKIDEIDAKPEVKAFAHRVLFFEPLPFVERVVFISTPHRGSYLTTDWVQNFVRKLITLPINLVIKSPEYLRNAITELKLPASARGDIPTSIDGMSSKNPLLQSLVALPLVDGVAGHSIIAVKPDMEIATGNDGVVEYKSAHIDNMESEFIVRSGHSCQGHPFVIEEVRRVLLRHIGQDVASPVFAENVPLSADNRDDRVRLEGN